MSTFKVGIIGVGTVGESVVKILQDNATIIEARCGRRIEAVHGVVKNLSKKRSVDMPLSDDVNAILDDPSIDLVVELMGGVDEPYAVVKKALQKGKAVVTANKALLAYHRYELQEMAGDLAFEYEASVAGGVPIVAALREGLCANNILGLQGIMNGTCNYILTRMRDEGVGYEEVLADAQRLGYAEADPTLDVGGFDAAHKLLILASIAYGLDAKPEDILIEGLHDISPVEIEFGQEFGYSLKLLTIAKTYGEKVELRVHPAFVPKDKMIAKIDGVMNGVSVEGDFVGETLYYGAGAGGDATASAVVANIIDVVRTHKRSPMLGFAHTPQKAFSLVPQEDITTKYYIRLGVSDEVGVLSKVASVFGECGVSMEKILQKPSGGDLQGALLLLSTHTTQEKHIKTALGKLQNAAFIKQKPFVVRIEES